MNSLKSCLNYSRRLRCFVRWAAVGLLLLLPCISFAQTPGQAVDRLTCEQQLTEVRANLSVQGEYLNRLLRVRNQQESTGIASEHIIKEQGNRIDILEKELAKLRPVEKK